MLIGLDARTIYRPTRRGTGKNLIDLYTHLADTRPDWQVVAYHRHPGPVDTLLPRETVQPKFIEMVGDRVDAWQRWRLPMAAWRDNLNVLHCPANACPAWMPVNTVVTIHDLIPLDMAASRRATDVRRFEQSVRTACRRAAGIICPSKYTRDRLVRQFNADPDRITVNAWAPDSSVRPVPQERWQPVLDEYGVDRPFVLHFGAAAPRKNTRGLIEAWAMSKHAIRKQWQLLIIGLDPQTHTRMAAAVKQLGLQDSVCLHGFAREQHLPTLLSAAEVLAYPSLSEGFGLPILDAWAAGTAVMTSNSTSLPEVAADAAVLVDPIDCCSIARAINQLCSEHRLREELVEMGRHRLRFYSWEKTAQRFAYAIERAAETTRLVRARAAA